MKKQTSNLFFSISILVCVALKPQAQLASYSVQHERTYQATQNGRDVGWVRITGTQSGNERILKSESQLHFQMLLSFDAVAIMYDHFAGDLLIKSSVYRTLNGKVKLDNLFQLTNGSYKTVKGVAEKKVDKPVYRTVISLYFMEPIDITEIFSEVYMCFIPVEKISPHEYKTPLPDGGVMSYHYVNGELVKVVANTSLATVHFKLRK